MTARKHTPTGPAAPARRDDRSVVDGRSPAELRRAFHLFGRVEAPQVDSPLYAELSYGASLDPDVLAIAAEARPGQPAPNLLYAAVQYLLLDGQLDDLLDEPAHRLAVHYPALSGAERPQQPAFPAFRDFCLAHRDRIVPLLRTRLTQTNVIQRCICLLPAFAHIHARTGRALALIEIGPSAGLNLNWDRYRYTYPALAGVQSRVDWGPPGSPVQLTTERRGDLPLPHLPSTIPVASRLGIDLHPVNPADDDAMRWLRALIWPEHVERHARLAAAVEVARAHPPPLVAGDALTLLPGALAEAPPDAALTVFATHALYQLPRDRRRDLLRGIQAHAREAGRRIDFVSMEATGPSYSELTHTVYNPRGRDTVKLADCNPHGRWLHWLAPSRTTA